MSPPLALPQAPQECVELAQGSQLTPGPDFLSPLDRFPSNLLFTSASGELWKMVRIGGQPLGFGEPWASTPRWGDLGLSRSARWYEQGG